MNLESALPPPHRWLLQLARRVEADGAAVVGAGVVATMAAINDLVGWITGSYQWVFLILAAKPLIDLTWRWEFLEVVHQRINPQAILAGIVILLNAIVAVSRSQEVKQARVVKLLCGCAALSVFLTPSAWGINELIRLFAGASFFFSAAAGLGEGKQFDRFCIAFLAALCVPLVGSFLQVVGILPFEYFDWLDNQEVGRASGTYQHPLEIVFFLVYAVPVGLYRLERSSKVGLERKFLLIFFMLGSLALVFTYHRTGWIAISLEAAIWFLLKQQTKKILFLAAALGILGVLFSGWVSLLYQPAADIARGQVDIASGEFLRGRGVNWAVFLASYANAGPVGWLIGRGGSVADQSVGGLADFAENEPHNDFIRLLHAYGLIGLFLYVSLLVSFLRQGLRLHHSRIPFQSGVGKILLCSLAGVLLLSFTAEPMRYPTSIWYLFAFGSIGNVSGEQARHSALSRTSLRPEAYAIELS